MVLDVDERGGGHDVHGRLLARVLQLLELAQHGLLLLLVARRLEELGEQPDRAQRRRRCVLDLVHHNAILCAGVRPGPPSPA